jgi:hypothetical protein
MLFIRFGPFLYDAAGESPHLGRAGATGQGLLSTLLGRLAHGPGAAASGHEDAFPPPRLSGRLASLALRPAHSRGHQVVTAIRRLQPFRYLHDCSDCFRLERIAGWALHRLESAAFSRRTPIAVI